jgi:hypothetical protein
MREERTVEDGAFAYILRANEQNAGPATQELPFPFFLSVFFSPPSPSTLTFFKPAFLPPAPHTLPLSFPAIQDKPNLIPQSPHVTKLFVVSIKGGGSHS